MEKGVPIRSENPCRPRGYGLGWKNTNLFLPDGQFLGSNWDTVIRIYIHRDQTILSLIHDFHHNRLNLYWFSQLKLRKVFFISDYPLYPYSLYPSFNVFKVCILIVHRFCILTGDLYYLHIHKPDLNQPLEVQMAQADYVSLNMNQQQVIIYIGHWSINCYGLGDWCPPYWFQDGGHLEIDDVTTYANEVKIN